MPKMNGQTNTIQNIKVWDRKYNSWMFVPSSKDGITSQNENDTFIAKSGKGYKFSTIQQNESLSEEVEKIRQRFVIHN